MDENDITELKQANINLQTRLTQANTRAFNAEQNLTSFKEEIVTLATDYLRMNGKCRDLTDALDALGLSLPNPVVSFTVCTRVNVTITVPFSFDQDPENREFLEQLVTVHNDGTVEIEGGQLEDVSVDGGELDSIEDVHLED